MRQQTACCMCGERIKATIRLNPTCSAKCSKARKKQRDAAWRANNLERSRKYDRERMRRIVAGLTPKQREARAKRMKAANRKWRTENHAHDIERKRAYRKTSKGRAVCKVYHQKYVEANRKEINAYMREWSRARRRKTNPDFLRKVKILNLRKSPNHIKHHKQVARELAVRRYWQHREAILEWMRKYDRTPERAQRIRERRRLGAAAYRFLTKRGVIPVVTGDQHAQRRAHTVALAAVRQLGFLDSMEIAA